MILEFEEIINPQFKTEIKNLKEQIKNIFKKKENGKEKYIRKYALKYVVMCAIFVLFLVVSLILTQTTSNIFGSLLILSIIKFIVVLFSSIFIEDSLEQEKNKVKFSFLNILSHYEKKSKNINAKKINKNLKVFNKKQKEIIEFINDNKLYTSSNDKIQKEVLKAKLNSCSTQEFKSKENIVMDFVNNLDNLKEKVKFENLINKKINSDVSLFQEKQLVNNIEKEKEIVNMI